MGATEALTGGVHRALRAARRAWPSGADPARSGRPEASGAGPRSPDTLGAGPQPPAWTDAELTSFRVALEADLGRLRAELAAGEAELADLTADSADDTGDDQADAGAKTFGREHEMSVNANLRELIRQADRAMARLDDGTYGVCEGCGSPIPAGRLRAQPRATRCVACQRAEERR